MMRILSVVFFLFVTGCSSMMRYAHERYPNCIVEKVDEDTVLVRCPGKLPFEKKLRKAG